eukprot:g2491.t1
MVNEYRRRQCEERVNKAIAQVRKVLDTARNPQYIEGVAHEYDDKYVLAECAVRGAIATTLEALRLIGLSDAKLKQLLKWSRAKQSVTLHFTAEERCVFDRTESREVESPTKVVQETTGVFGSGSKTTKIVNTVTKHFWRFTNEWELSVYTGADVDDKITLLQHNTDSDSREPYEITTSVKTMPRSKIRVLGATGNEYSVSLDWLLSLFNEQGDVSFSIDRTKSDCYTPRRNKDIEESLSFYRELSNFVAALTAYINELANVATDDARTTALGIMKMVDPSKSDEMFSLVMAMFTLEEKENGNAITMVPDFSNLLEELNRSLRSVNEEARRITPSSSKTTIGPDEATLLVALSVGGSNTLKDLRLVVETIRDILWSQVVSAIGKTVQPSDFAEYMDYHNRNLYREPFAPRGFCYNIRRPDHSPEGQVSIEVMNGGETRPINTTVLHAVAKAPMRFALNAASEVSFYGDRFVHAATMHKFSNQSSPSLKLFARARQFSSFVLMVGKIAGPDLFEPTASIVVKDKDSLEIPLLLETIPSAKEFKEAIVSISPEQQRFCKAFRSMQLSSTLFGICVIQIKPQLEKLLNLAPDSLTKEIALCQDLSDLFINYQIPSDLLSFDGDEETSKMGRIAAVKEHVSSVRSVIDAEKEKELKKREMEEKKRQMANIVGGGNVERGGGVDLIEASAAFSAPPVQMMARSMAMAPLKSKKVWAKPHARMAKSRRRAHPRSVDDAVGGAPPPAPGPPQSTPRREKVKESKVKAQSSEEQLRGNKLNIVNVPKGAVDYTAIPKLLDARMETLDKEGSLRPTIIKAGKSWKRSSQDGLLSKPTMKHLNESMLKDEKNKAFDLLDALTRSGVVSIDCAELHVVMAATHCFDETLMETIVDKNTNPIERVEKSGLIVTSTIQGRKAVELVQPNQMERLTKLAPLLLENLN